MIDQPVSKYSPVSVFRIFEGVDAKGLGRLFSEEDAVVAETQPCEMFELTA